MSSVAEKREINDSQEPLTSDDILKTDSGIKRQKLESNQGEQPPVPSRPKQCHFYVKRKRRYCSLTTKLGFKYCGEHLTCASEEEIKTLELQNSEASDKNSYSIAGKRRIPCPFDAKHSTVESFLLQLKKEGDVLVPGFLTEVLDHDSLCKQKEKKTDIKHADQQASLIGHLEKNGLLDPKNCFIEFGAGKGELSLYVYHALKSAQLTNEKAKLPNQASPFVLVDRNNFRFKGIPQKSKNSLFHRVTIDIKDLDLTKLEIIQNRPVVAFSKHLCGAATDLTLRSLSHFAKAGTSGKIAGIVIALCCHHACSVNSYTGLDFLLEKNIIGDVKQFSWLSSIGSWATCGLRDNAASHGTNYLEVSSESTHFTGLPHREREQLGYTAKRVIDLGRLEYARSVLGLDSKLVHYVSKELSLENLALVAIPGKIDENTN
ncbi:tRNA:m4X modification enzyme [Entomophthora muscae]|uniref:tRNA:m4X modification enzyme n=1 Tax=Entomophthora muscae TaxID=34485 RepID=A0ACC2T788_9FUNG|nr:tRNA:m4X modification enzyme [Entomophthora muscae]